MAAPRYSMNRADPAAGTDATDDPEDDVLEVTPAREVAVDGGWPSSPACAGGASGWPARAPPPLVPIPKARAPKAPWVEVWLSPQNDRGARAGEADWGCADHWGTMPMAGKTSPIG